MKFRGRNHYTLGTLIVAASAVLCASSVSAAITVGHIDDFQDGTAQYWRVGAAGHSVPSNVANAGPQGVGDSALYSKSGGFGFPPKLVVITETNSQFPGPGNWEGNWTAAGVTQIAMDVRNPGTLPNATALTLRLAIAGPGGISQSGDVYVTEAMTVPPDNVWRSLVFDVLPADFTAAGTGMNINAALADVRHLRILNSPFADFAGISQPAEIYLDNIHALGPLSGDYNGNGAVDAADYVVWRQLNGQSGTGLAADGTGATGTPDGVVNSLDYDFWRAHFGNSRSAAGHAHGLIADPATIPEPATALLCGAGIFWFAAVCRRTRRCEEPAN